MTQPLIILSLGTFWACSLWATTYTISEPRFRTRKGVTYCDIALNERQNNWMEQRYVHYSTSDVIRYKQTRKWVGVGCGAPLGEKSWHKIVPRVFFKNSKWFLWIRKRFEENFEWVKFGGCAEGYLPTIGSIEFKNL